MPDPARNTTAPTLTAMTLALDLPEPAPAADVIPVLPASPADRDWTRDAACDDGSDLTAWAFYPATGDDRTSRVNRRDNDRLTAAAKAVCARCPVIAECLGMAIATREPFGIWGGQTPAERADTRTRLDITPLPRHGTPTGYVHDGCRCPACSAAWAAARAAERAREAHGPAWPAPDPDPDLLDALPEPDADQLDATDTWLALPDKTDSDNQDTA